MHHRVSLPLHHPPISHSLSLLSRRLPPPSAPLFPSHPRPCSTRSFLDGDVSLVQGVADLAPPNRPSHDTWLGVEPYTGSTLDFHWRVAVNALVAPIQAQVFQVDAPAAVARAAALAAAPARARGSARRSSAIVAAADAATLQKESMQLQQQGQQRLAASASAASAPNASFFPGVAPVFLPLMWTTQDSTITPAQADAFKSQVYVAVRVINAVFWGGIAFAGAAGGAAAALLVTAVCRRRAISGQLKRRRGAGGGAGGDDEDGETFLLPPGTDELVYREYARAHAYGSSTTTASVAGGPHWRERSARGISMTHSASGGMDGGGSEALSEGYRSYSVGEQGRVQ